MYIEIDMNYDIYLNYFLQIPLIQCTESTLGEICGSRRRNKFVVMDKDGVQPMKSEVSLMIIF